ncbi:MAG: nicotinate-nucleotide--dimethylbenzimidazole phosphoribosyltransferase [Oscillospiraceae bacterium]|nr:nicotinate-nucleotide--dimethylbenzimidazole phosphoribosyltransferase [Oscillospiraceae bacterium]
MDDERIYARKAQERLNSVAMPIGGLGLLGESIMKIAEIQQTENIDISRRAAVIFCADNGVVRRRVSQSDHLITSKVAQSIAAGQSNVNILAAYANTEIFVADVGIAGDTPPGCLNFKLLRGTDDIADGPAMERQAAMGSAEIGVGMVKTLSSAGYKLLICGEMGIGNTTIATAVTCALTGAKPSDITGLGAGGDMDMLRRKIKTIEEALAVNNPSKEDEFDILSKVGGIDLGAMMGMYLGGMKYNIPIVIDGAVSLTAAALAYLYNPEVKNYMIPSHASSEKLAKVLFEYMDLKAPIDAGLHIGEATGGVMLMPMLDMAIGLYNSKHTFESLDMEQYKIYEDA